VVVCELCGFQADPSEQHANNSNQLARTNRYGIKVKEINHHKENSTQHPTKLLTIPDTNTAKTVVKPKKLPPYRMGLVSVTRIRVRVSRLSFRVSVRVRDVNETRQSRVSIFFLDPGKGISGLPRIQTSDRLTIEPIVSGIIATCRSTSVDCCLLHRGHGPHTRRTDATKQRTVAYLRVRDSNSRRFCRRVLITLVMPLHRPGSANATASVCLYRVGQKHPDCF